MKIIGFPKEKHTFGKIGVFSNLSKKTWKKSSKMMEKSMPDLYKIRYKIGMLKKVERVWTKYGKWSKMGVQSGPENQENVIKVRVWKVVEKVEKKT